MKKTTLFKKFIILILTISIAVVAVNCKKKKKEDTTPPTLPPPSSMVMNYDDFKKSAMKDADSVTSVNHDWAAFNVGVWNLILTVGLAVPVASFYEAFNHQYVQEGDNLWVWTYSFVVANVNHTARLTGQYVENNQKVQWDMYITKDGFYKDYHWYTGLSAISGLEGNWTLNESPTVPSPLLGIDWHRNTSTGASDIKYTNVKPGGPENGGYIYYAVTPGAELDAIYDIYNKGQDNLTNIQWNRASKNGRIKDPKHFLNSDWHCWDNTFADCVCP
jgi:hypothetical protein